MLTRKQKDEIVRLDAMMKPGAISELVGCSVDQVKGYLYRIAHDRPKPKSPKLAEPPPRCPEHLKRLADKWREKHGDRLVIGCP